MQVLIDGDILLYKAGFAVERSRFYRLSIKRSDKSYDTFDYKSIKDFTADWESPEFVRSNNVLEVIADTEPFSHAVYNYKSLVKKIIKETKADSFDLVLSGPSSINARYQIATTKPYKGNRDPLEKPIYFDRLKEWVISNLTPSISDRGEADDYMGIVSTRFPEQMIIATIDKDLMMIPGLNYNIDSGHLQLVSDPGELWIATTKSGTKQLKGYGFKWFCAQMLLGDIADNIPGVKGYGPVKTLTALNKYTTIRSMWAAIIKLYRKHKITDRLDEIRRLLWIQREQLFEEVTSK